MNFNKFLHAYYIFSFLLILFFVFSENYQNDSTICDVYDSNFVYDKSTNLDIDVTNDQKININTATKDILLKYLWGIGNSKVQNIINYREKMGGFYSVDEILNVKGIGESVFSKIKEKICI